LPHLATVSGGWEKMVSRPEILCNETAGQEEALDMTRWCKALRAAFPDGEWTGASFRRDDFGWDTVMCVAIGGWCIHVRCIAHQSGAGQVAQQLDNAIFRHMGSLVNLLQLNVINPAGKCTTASVIALMQRRGGSCFPTSLCRIS
jgi:hypothetical protein